MRVTLIEQWQNPKGRRLIQENDNLTVLSECCDYNIESLYRGEDGVPWMRCVNCERLLQDNSANLWNCHIQRIGPTSTSERWDAWARDIFGYENFKLEVTV